MAKRGSEFSEEYLSTLKDGKRPLNPDGINELGDCDFEDQYEDEFESEDEIFEAGVDGRPDEDREAEEQDAMDVDQSTFIPGRNKLAPGEILSPDPSTYHLLHTLETTWPCLSFDIVRDNLGDSRKTFPATLYAVAGTQAAQGREKENRIMVMKLSGLSKMEREDDSDDEDDEEEGDPILEVKEIPLSSTTNRIRAHQTAQGSAAKPPTTLTAAMTESGQVLIHDITPHLTHLSTVGATITQNQMKPLHTIRAHGSAEGYGIDWSPTVNEGKLLTGDCSGRIFETTCRPDGSFVTDSKPFTGHQGTVEEIQWSPSPSDRTVFASASSDGTVKIWDTRSKKHKHAISVRASATDVNVLSWSRLTDFLLASGHDDGEWAVWDLRQWKEGKTSKESSYASYNFHKEQITSVEWHPTDNSMVLVAAGDNTLTLWDISVEFDDEESKDTAGVDVPPALLFVHYQEQVKEAHWHPQIPGAIMATGGSGFGVFKTFNV